MQKVVKVFAIALAVVITGSIISAIAGAGMFVSFMFEGWQRQGGDVAVVDLHEDESVDDADKVEIDIKGANVYVKAGNKLKVESNSDDIDVYHEGDTLKIRENEWHFFEDWDENKVVVTLPEGMSYLKLSAVAGQVELADIVVDELVLGLGAGRAELRNVRATEKAKIDGGAGNLTVSSSDLRNLDFDMGAGRAKVEARLAGDNDIDAGMGRLELALIGDEDDYRVEVDQGIGTITWHGIGADNAEGKHLVKVDGGVGSIDIGLVSAY